MVFCTTHSENLIDRAVFRHLRQQHNATRGGKNTSKKLSTDLTKLSIEMTATNVRELIFRAMKHEFEKILEKLKQFNTFQREPAMYSERITVDRLETDHHIIFGFKDSIVTPQVIKSIPFNVPFELFTPFTHIEYDEDDDDMPIAIYTDSIQYYFEEIIAWGAYGTCFTVQKSTSSEITQVACKLIKKNFNDVSMATIAQNEKEIHEELHHQHVVQYLTSFDDEKYLFILMDLCATNLSDMMESQSFFEFDQCCLLIRQVLSGAAYLHEHQIIHRDLKLTNVLVDQNQKVKICDFGLSIKTDAPEDELRKFCGTVAYAAPETIFRRGAVTQSDVWSIGVMFFYMYKAKRPFDSAHDTESQIEEVYKRIFNAKYVTEPCDDPLFVEFVGQVFNRNPNNRPSARQCLEMPNFANDLMCKYNSLSIHFL